MQLTYQYLYSTGIQGGLIDWREWKEKPPLAYKTLKSKGDGDRAVGEQAWRENVERRLSWNERTF